MSYSSELYRKAEMEIHRRRIQAETSMERRQKEIERELPEICEIQCQLAMISIELSKAILQNHSSLQENISHIRTQNLQGQEMIKKLLIEHHYPETYLEPQYFCVACEDKGYVNGRRCQCLDNVLKKLAVESLNNTSGINLCSFDSFNLSYYPIDNGIRDQMKTTYEYCLHYARTFSPSSKSIFMLGMTGLGKTHLSLAIAAEVLANGYSVAYDSIVNYLRLIEKEHFRRNASDESDTMDLLLSTDLLILDDLGSEFSSSFYVATIYNLINTRLNRNLPTIISSNLTPKELQDRYEDRMVSRLFAIYDYLRFVGNDIRQLKRIQQNNLNTETVFIG